MRVTIRQQKTENIEILRKILEIEQKQPISYEEAFEVANCWLVFMTS